MIQEEHLRFKASLNIQPIMATLKKQDQERISQLPNIFKPSIDFVSIFHFFHAQPSTKKVYKIIPEQRYIKKLNEKQNSDMIKLTCQRPNERANKMNESMKILKHDQNGFLDDFKISLSNEMINLDARVLPGPKNNYHPHNNENSILTPDNVSWNVRGLKVI
ncbi:hypothetical protein K502DRAFT_330103 [Neoconidiobolus thromboides FSU 785]|nr:hypothetical protein K502DRAFT_330103 [Neoconidiobolus thromboides FSU 785]